MALTFAGGLLLVAAGLVQPSLDGDGAKNRTLCVQIGPADVPRRSGSASVHRVGAAQRPWIGIQIQKVEQDYAEALGLPDASGALIISVEDAGPAGAAGLSVGDVVVAIDGKPTASPRQLAKSIGGLATGTQAQLTINRNGETQPINVTVGERPKP